MGYKLKDELLQLKLDFLSHGEFSKQLSKEQIVTMVDDSGHPVLKVEFGPTVGNSWTRKFALVFEKDEIENTVKD